MVLRKESLPDKIEARESRAHQIAILVRLGLIGASAVYVIMWIDVFFGDARVRLAEWASLAGFIWLGVLGWFSTALKRADRESSEEIRTIQKELKSRRTTEDMLVERYRDKVQRVESLLSEGSLRPVFQPIVRLDNSEVIALEALSRFDRPEGRSPAEWFRDAYDLGLGPELEVLAMSKALAEVPKLPHDCLVSMNVTPETLTSKMFHDCLQESDVPLDRLILEVTEHAVVDDYQKLIYQLTGLRSAGVRVAVDDVGAGFSSLTHLLRLEPEMIKLDRSLISLIHERPSKHAIVSALDSFGRSVNAMVVAEGVETPEELEAIRDCGVQFAQGYLLCRPSPAPVPPILQPLSSHVRRAEQSEYRT
jgi:EAL domain-containing protein (putative c-di-GMP-specific phosphodiesterase class I)